MKKLRKQDIEFLLNEINTELKKKNIRGEIALYGGAVMLLVFDARDVTKDIDAIFVPKKEFTETITHITEKYKLQDDWLNDGIKGFVDNNKGLIKYQTMSNLIIYVAKAEYILAMKCHASRVEPDSKDKEDIKFLIKYLKLKNVDEVLNLVEKYIPKSRIETKTQYFVEEIIDEIDREKKKQKVMSMYKYNVYTKSIVAIKREDNEKFWDETKKEFDILIDKGKVKTDKGTIYKLKWADEQKRNEMIIVAYNIKSEKNAKRLFEKTLNYGLEKKNLV